MKSLFHYAYLLAATATVVVQAQFAISEPAAGATVAGGKDLNVKILVPVLTSNETAQRETGLVVGILNCGSTPCPEASKDLGQIIFVGVYEGQGTTSSRGTLNNFQNLNLRVPSGVSGNASIQVQHNYVFTMSNGHSTPQNTQYTSLAVTVTPVSRQEDVSPVSSVSSTSLSASTTSYVPTCICNSTCPPSKSVALASKSYSSLLSSLSVCILLLSFGVSVL